MKERRLMKLNRSKFAHYLDIISFVAISITSTAYMMIGIAQKEQIMQPAISFTVVYLMNLIYYRLCLEFENIYISQKTYIALYSF